MIEKIKKRKENNFSISHAEQHHRRKGKDKNKRKKQKNSFKDIEFLENNNYENDNYYSINVHDIVEIQDRLSKGEEVKLLDLKMTQRILKNKNIKDKVGSYKFNNGYILDIISFINNKNVFLIRKV